MQFFTFSLLTISLLTLSLVSGKTERQGSIIGSPKKIERRPPTTEAERIKRQQQAEAKEAEKKQQQQRFAWDQPKADERMKSQRASGRKGSILSEDILDSILGKKPTAESPRRASKIDMDALLDADAVRKPAEGTEEKPNTGDIFKSIRQASEKLLKDVKLDGKDPLEMLKSPELTQNIRKMSQEFVKNMDKTNVDELMGALQNEDVMKSVRDMSQQFMKGLGLDGPADDKAAPKDPNDLLKNFYDSLGKNASGQNKFDGILQDILGSPKKGGLFADFFEDLTSDGEEEEDFLSKMAASIPKKMKMKRDV